MKKIIVLIIVLKIISLDKNLSGEALAAEKSLSENSDPYITLLSTKPSVVEGEEFELLINFGNKGPEPADNVKIVLNQPLDGRSPLEFLSSDPIPDKWITSEYGNLAEFLIARLETFEATEEGKINVKVRVRESVASQTITPTVNLQAPNRESGKRLIVSEAALVQIKDDLEVNPVNGGQREEPADQETIEIEPVQSVFKIEPQTQEEKKESSLGEKILASESIWTIGAFLVLSFFIIFAFIAGRKSNRK
jgi:hypothetical protein